MKRNFILDSVLIYVAFCKSDSVIVYVYIRNIILVDVQGLDSQQNQYKVQELTARLRALQQETELIQTLMSPHIVGTSQSLPTLSMENSASLNNTSQVAVQKTVKVRCVFLP